MGSFQKTYNDTSFLSELAVPRPPDNHIKPERGMLPIALWRYTVTITSLRFNVSIQ